MPVCSAKALARAVRLHGTAEARRLTPGVIARQRTSAEGQEGLRAFLENRATSFIGLRPDGQFDRYWRFWMMGAYLQHEFQATPRLSLNTGLRYEFTTMPGDINGRDSALINLTDTAPTTGRLFDSPGYLNFSPRVGFAWSVDGSGRTAVRGGRLAGVVVS